MNVGKYIYNLLKDDAGVSAIVSNRIYPVLIPQNATFPAIVYTTTTEPNDVQKDHVSHWDREVVTFRFWADVQQGADAYLSVTQIDDAVRTALDFVVGTVSSVEVGHCHFQSSTDVVSDDRLLLGREAVYTFITKR